MLLTKPLFLHKPFTRFSSFLFSALLGPSRNLRFRRKIVSWSSRSEFGAEMTIKGVPSIENGRLLVAGKVVLSGVPQNVVVSPASSGSAFLGAVSGSPSSRLVFNLGALERCRFMCLFRPKIWWMIPRVGKSGSEIPLETQLLLLEVREESALDDEISSRPPPENTVYILFLPVLDGQFRASLQGTSANELQLCVESGDESVQISKVLESVYVNSGDNPFELIKNSVKILEKHKGTFSHIENKKLPPHLDWFGWCTWDAFYTAVNPQGIKDGLQSFLDGGCLPKYIIIDDGWQDTVNLNDSPFSTRLVDIKENNKFKRSGPEDIDFHAFIDVIKEKYGLKYVYMWHALAGYWAGVLPSSEKMQKYNPRLVYPVQSPGNVGNLRDIAMDSLEKYGVGVIDPEKIYEFYNDLHGYLASSGVDGVKVDVQNLMETMGSGYGGRVTLTKRYQHALEESVARNFKDNNLICCMSHNTDCIYSSKISAVARASEDFMPREPMFQTLHIATVTFNSFLLGEIVVPDWDMFQSKHGTAEFHGAARAIGGCAVYVSDKPESHDFEVLKKIVLPDGSILRARHAGRPTRDCLFVDPVMDGESLMKIWNLNKFSGVVGVFNCQGAGSWPLKDGGQELPSTAPTLSPIVGHVSPLDVEFLDEITSETSSGDFAVFAVNSGSLSRLPKEGSLEISLQTLQFEIFTVSPIMVLGQNLHFAAIGLLDMYNSGGAIEDISCIAYPRERIVTIRARGCGRFGVFSSAKPKGCQVDAKEGEFTYNGGDGLLTVELQGACTVREIGYIY